MNKKGFTLIELLAVVVILAIIAIIAVPTLTRVIDKSNEGVSATRNRGILESKGEYLYFMDADDILHPQFLDFMVSETKRTNADIMVCKYAVFYNHPKYMQLSSKIKAIKIESGIAAFEYLASKGLATALWNKLLRNSQNTKDILFDTSMTYGEDMFYCWKRLLLAEKVYTINAPLYFYRQSPSGAITRYHDKLYEHYRSAFDDLESFGITHGIDKAILHKSICDHFARRIPSLIKMEYRAPYSKLQKEAHLLKLLNDKDICEGLQVRKEDLTDAIYDAARVKDVNKLLKIARKNHWISLILKPIKRLIK